MKAVETFGKYFSGPKSNFVDFIYGFPGSDKGIFKSINEINRYAIGNITLGVVLATEAVALVKIGHELGIRDVALGTIAYTIDRVKNKTIDKLDSIVEKGFEKIGTFIEKI